MSREMCRVLIVRGGYGDVYYWGSPPNQYAVRVTEPEMMNLPPINLHEASFVNIKDAHWTHDG